MSHTTDKKRMIDFEAIYSIYYPKLVRFSREYIGSKEDAENIVQDVFIVFWEQRGSMDELRNVNAYLFKLVKNKCIDFLRHKSRMDEKNCPIHEVEQKELQLKLFAIEKFDENQLAELAIEEVIFKAIDALPEKCREIFILSKLDGLKYQDIADQLNLSTNTVGNQISIALKKLKKELKGYYPLLVLLIFGS